MQTTSDEPQFPATGQESAEAIISDYTFYLPTIPANAHRTSANLRLSRPKLKISERDHMMVTIATDEDDVSTSSTDVENVKDDSAPTHRAKKRYKHAQKPKRRRSGSKTPTSSTSYTALALTDEKARKKQSAGKSASTLRSKSGERTPNENSLHNNAPLSTVESLDAYSIMCKGGSTHFQPIVGISTLSKEKVTDVGSVTAPELPLLKPPKPSAENVWSSLSEATKREEIDSMDDEPNDDSDVDDDQRRSDLYKNATASANSVPEPPDLTLGEGTDFQVETSVDDMGERSCCAAGAQNSGDAYHALGQAPTDALCTTGVEPEHILSSSPRDNGYLADTENIFYCSSFPKPCNSVNRHASARDETGHASADASSQRSTPSHSDDESTISPDLSERMRTIMPAALGLFRIRQSKVVQKAVHLTYFLTFLFMFACLLQLYTVFGVYGVLGTIPRPDPWPWLIFHTIFRATEFSIGLTTAFIAFFTLNHRHQRAKRRHLQQQHLDATRDCIV
ncbi:unnamed protein product [Lymnaea stagnalis]|uniref:Proline-rich transmembrane protein 3/4 domain-containing protein n=1 Tax=Lymnaea stagnalis TaxID=6523 RepID=A0AAV2H544_LYMST